MFNFFLKKGDLEQVSKKIKRSFRNSRKMKKAFSFNEEGHIRDKFKGSKIRIGTFNTRVNAWGRLKLRIISRVVSEDENT